MRVGLSLIRLGQEKGERKRTLREFPLEISENPNWVLGAVDVTV